MCGFYADKEKIKKGDRALYDGDEVVILEANHKKVTKRWISSTKTAPMKKKF